MIYLVVILFLSIFAAANIFIGLRGLDILRHFMPTISIYIYWALFASIALSMFIGRAGRGYLPAALDRVFNIIGGYWLAALVYFLIGAMLFGVVNIVIRLFKIKSYYRGNTDIHLILNLAAIFIIILLLAYGTYNAGHSKVINYEINIDKKAGALKELNIVTVSDIHLGSLIGKGRLDKMVSEINKLNPDIVFLAGDIIDDDIEPFINNNMGESFRRIKSKYGVYGVLGNHDYFGGSIEKVEKAYKEANINILRDKMVKVSDSFYVVGREDASAGRVIGGKRKEVSVITKDADKSLPLILLDHQPVKLEETKKAEVDLQFSGHTHKGQFFPAGLVTERVFKIDWGYLKEDNFNVIVSSGYGTWGPPIRVGSNSEIVRTIVKFSK
ncbi:metallophosphoesterase [Clostridium sp. CX1]|uniref:metallophosphoesterase n=1 Tax=Clostridium sp. CX1 TaxID=2978346 RepID=UPI0021C21C00|nr:metallophosphoesterase [Clostridium sp. CX1]MCT8976221.1 metallophosphoesterase [Clostridium sp. CX1]